MTDERITTEHPAADITPLPLTLAAPTAVQKQGAGTRANFRQVRLWLLAVAAFALVFLMVRVLLAPGDTPPAEELNRPTATGPDRGSGNEGGNAPQPSLSPDALFARSSPAVVQVVVQNRHGRAIGSGSGFLVSTTGLIATNYHVIEKAHKAHLVLADETKVPVLGVAAHDEGADLAIIKAGDQIGAHPLELAAGNLPPVGTKVYAIGNPLGLANTLSDGLLSGHREIDQIRVIQTTAPISPGSSGGPLIGADGRVVGITTFLFKGGQNLNFAVPSSHVARLLLRCQGEAQPTQLPLPNAAFRYIESGNAWLQKNDYSRAVRDFDEAIRLDPQSSEAYSGRGWAWAYKTNYSNATWSYDNAIRDFNAAIRLDPNNSEAYYGRGWIWANKQQFDNAIKDYSEAIRIDPKNFNAFRGRGWARHCKGDYEGSNQDYEVAKGLEGENTADNPSQWPFTPRSVDAISGQTLPGMWKLVKSSKGKLPVRLDAVMAFEKGGKVTMKVALGDKKQEAAGTWKLDGKKLTVEYTDGPPKGKKETMVVKKLTDEELVTVDEKDVTEEFKRIKDAK